MPRMLIFFLIYIFFCFYDFQPQFEKKAIKKKTKKHLQRKLPNAGNVFLLSFTLPQTNFQTLWNI